MLRKLLCIALIVVLSSCKDDSKSATQKEGNLSKTEKTTISLSSKDSLLITADVYKVNDKPISILLCHQAGFSRGEYINTAKQLNTMGYSVMAIDQRSGKAANDVVNETAKLAKEHGLATSYLDARQDIEAAIDYVYANNGNTPILLVGSSYSATLSLLIGKETNKVKAIASFSPGEYFKGMDINDLIKDLNKPTFVTASKAETEALSVLVNQVDEKVLTHYKPTEKGIHGSRALWNNTDGYKGYWKAFTAFLKAI